MSFIDYQDPRPVYEQIVDHYQKLILQGILEKDEQIPSVRQMAAELSINPNTIQKAFTVLEKTGYLYTVRGRGNFVSDCTALAEEKKKVWINGLEQMLREGKALGIQYVQCASVLDAVYGREKDDRDTGDI